MKKLFTLLLLFAFSSLLMAQQSSRPAPPKVTLQPTTPAQQLDFQAEKKAPQYNGGREAMFRFIHDNMKYPADAKEKGIQGDVLLKFFVAIDGSITKIEVVQGLYPSLDAEAVRVVKLMPKWIPGRYGVQNAGMYSSLIIGFHLSE